MREKTIKLLERASALCGYSEGTISLWYGNTHAAKRLRRGSASIETVEKFQDWLERFIKAAPKIKKTNPETTKDWMLGIKAIMGGK